MCDGHGGSSTAAYFAEHFSARLMDSPSYESGNLTTAMSEASLVLFFFLVLFFLMLFFLMLFFLALFFLMLFFLSLIMSSLDLVHPFFSQAIVRLDADLKDAGVANNSGATVVCAVIRGDQLHLASLGDSVVLLGRGVAAEAVFEAHNGNLASERERILALGGSFSGERLRSPSGTGSLAVTKAAGDFSYKSPECGPVSVRFLESVSD